MADRGMTQGNLTIVSMFRRGEPIICLEIYETSTHQKVLEIKVNPASFALALTGVARQPCEIVPIGAWMLDRYFGEQGGS